jgi:2-polyprenyl-3-methyl-5-hydroxy-6-metoxy-1,4-benzoquinol methylase
MCLDILHDCPFPDKILRTIHSVLKPNGTLLIKDIRSTGSFSKNLETMPTLSMLYGRALLILLIQHC